MPRRGLVSAIVHAQREAQRAEAARQREASRAARAAEQAVRSYERAQKAEERERARLYAEARLAEVERDNQRLDESVGQLQTLLARTLEIDDNFDLETLRPQLDLPIFNPEGLDQAEPPPEKIDFLPKPPSLFAKLLPGTGARYAREAAEAESRFEEALQAHAARDLTRREALARARQAHHERVFALEAEHDAQNAAIDDLKRRFHEADASAVSEYFMYVLTASAYPEEFPSHVRVAYTPASKQLIVEKDFPQFQVVPDVDSYRYIKARDDVTAVARSMQQRKALYTSVVAQVTIRTLHELFEADRTQVLDSVVLNGYVDAIDPGSGMSIRPCIVTVRTTRDVFQRLNLQQVEPVACLKVLNASVSRSPSELSPVRPVVEFSMVDPRFIEESDVLSTLDQRPNLMELTPSEFETLITNLFEKMGLETRLTQASRDGGVDCVAYDSRPIFGGKVVIQAKRYKYTVGVSAVRDLFGTMQNEGASKGILVTTSGYGKASIEFANGKPIELLDGQNLLYLLKQHAGLDAKIAVTDGWRDPVPDTSDED
jgi:restriction system protein